MNKKYRVLSLICAACICGAMLGSCKNETNNSSVASNQESDISSAGSTADSSTENSSDSTGPAVESTNGGSANAASSKKPVNNNSAGTPSKDQGGSTAKATTLYVKNFGAKGDGKTDDAEAIMLGLSKLQECGKGSTLVFDSNKTYYAKTNGLFQSIFTMSTGENLTIKGNNTTILIDAPAYYALIENTRGLTIQGFNFDYKTKPAFRATAVSVDQAARKAVMIADRDIGLENGEEYIPSVNAGGSWFGVLDKPTGRYHMYIASYKMISKSERKFEVRFTTDSNTKAWMSQLSNGVALTAPMPYVGHMVERAFSFSGNTNLTMKNCNVYAMSRFGFAVFESEGTVRFDHVNIVRGPSEADKKLNFTGWRDGFHCKENRAKIIWDNCKVEGLYDDMMNISASTMYVKETNAAKDEINMYWPETSGAYAPLKAGDKLTVINTKTGQLIGSTTVKRVMKQSGSDNRIKLSQPLPKLTATGTNVLVFFDSMAAPGSEIKNCNLDGTFRFRGPITVTNTRFYNRRMWINLESNVEGPVPQNILFKGCQFDLDDPSGIYFHITSANSSQAADAYRLKNIVFDNCKVRKSNMEIGAGDDVRLVNCK